MVKLQVQDLHFHYAKTPILEGIDLALCDGEIISLVGPNGSGKSTLLKCMTGLLRPSEGIVVLNQQNLSQMDRRDIAKTIGYVPQSGREFLSDTVFDVVLMGRHPYATCKINEKDMDITADILAMLGLADMALRNFSVLSGGQQQRVLIARALAQCPQLLFLDEPTSALDIAHQLEVMDIVKEIVVQQKLSVFMVIHDLNLAARYSDKIAMLHQGRIYASGTADQALTNENIAHVYGVETHIANESGLFSILPIKRI